MNHFEVSAPGKLVLFGEYAVLFGAPAAVATVDRRAVVTIGPADGERWEVSAPGLSPQPVRFEIGPGGATRWSDEGTDRNTFGLVEKLVAGVHQFGSINLERLPAAGMMLDTRAFFEHTGAGRSKLGLGSSAALTVALATALEAWSGDASAAEPEQRLQYFVDLHRGIQGGAGSGIDVAASLLGGVVRYRLSSNGSVADASPLDLPGNLRTVCVWTGRGASTGDFLERLKARRKGAPAVIDPVLDQLRDVSSDGVAALAGGDPEAFLEAVEVFWEILSRLGEAIGMPIISEEHRRLHQLARASDVRYKPSGAGGGDFGIGFTADARAASEFEARAGESGFRVPRLIVGTSGVTRSRS